MRRGIWLGLIVVVGVLCAGSGFAQESASGIGDFDPEGEICLCASEEGTNLDGCWEDVFCAGAVQCMDSSDCAANETCWRGDNCCGVPICAVTCTGGEVCENPAGTCGTYEFCVAGVPSMGQWGLASLAVLIGLSALLLIWNKKGFSAPTAFLLLMIGLSLGAYSVHSIRGTMDSCEPESVGELAAVLFLDE